MIVDNSQFSAHTLSLAFHIGLQSDPLVVDNCGNQDLGFQCFFIDANPPFQILRDWIFMVVGGDYRTHTEEEALNSGTFITPEGA